MGVYSAAHYWRVSEGPIHSQMGLMHICGSRFTNVLIALWLRVGKSQGIMMPSDWAGAREDEH